MVETYVRLIFTILDSEDSIQILLFRSSSVTLYSTIRLNFNDFIKFEHPIKIISEQLGKKIEYITFLESD